MGVLACCDGEGFREADYRIAYEELQKYLFKVGPISLIDGKLLSEIVDFFETGVAARKSAMELIGPDVAAFCDDLIGDEQTYAHLYRESTRKRS